MRNALLLPLVLVAAGGCGTSSKRTQETAYRVPARDLTLQEADAPQVEVASPVELARTAVHRASHRVQYARRSAPQPHGEAAPAGATPAAPAAVSVPSIASEAAPAVGIAAEPADPHALAPGQTVTIIPASNGPITDAAPAERRRPESGRGVVTMHPGGHGGGGCEPRGGGGRRTGAGAFRLTL